MNDGENRHILQAQELFFSYRDDKSVLAGINFNARPERVVCVLGPNGSGKSTLMRCLMGWLRPQKGQILLDGQAIGDYPQKELARLLAYVPQAPSTAFAFSALELVLMGRYAHGGVLGLTTQKDIDIARAAMRMTHTDGFENRTLDELSGGEAQCVMIARALAQQPSVILMDEPTNHLDIRNQLMIYRMMQRLAHDWKIAVVCVSHDVNLAARFADELVFMCDGQIIAMGEGLEVINQSVLERVYGVGIHLIQDGKVNIPFVTADYQGF